MYRLLTKLQILFVIALSFAVGLPTAMATHIVGGVIRYECLSYNQSTNTMTLRISLRVYRDAINGQAPFDNPAIVGVFAGNNTTTPIQTLQLSNPVISTVPVDIGNPCLIIPPNVGVQEAVYQTTITIPFNASGYWFSYQRCCRNNSINNLINPGAVGSTYTIFMTAHAQTICNDSPVFNNFPPVVICRNEPLVFDHAATDTDGHTLRYSFCHPNTGASSASPAPNPPSGPPYGLVPFSAGFNASNPMPGAPGLSIDPITGRLTGTPTQLGQYVVGVCVEEFDSSGILVSKTLRDFQFNVAICDNRINAAIQSDSISSAGLGYVVNSCDNNVITFINQSTIQSLITAYEWRFNLNNGSFATSSQMNPTITFPGPGLYTGWLVVNPGQQGCTDTAAIAVQVFPPIFPNFRVVIDSCNPAIPPIQFLDQSTVGGNNRLVRWLWNFGDGTTSTQQNPLHSFPNAGTYNVRLTVFDTNQCSKSILIPVSWFPPAVPAFTVNDPDGCEPHNAIFTHTSFPYLPSYVTNWNFGDGTPLGTGNPVAHSYPNPGTYSVTLTHISPWGCLSSLTHPNMITVYEGPNANYTYTYDSCEYAAVSFFDASTAGGLGAPVTAWLWDFKDGTTSNLQNPQHLYTFAGSYPVDLTVTDANGCTNTISDSIHWYPKPVINVQIGSAFGCAPYAVFFDNQSYPINGYSTVWDFGDGTTDTTASPTHVFQNPGIYYVNLVITSPLGCTDTFRDTIEVFQNPTSSFSFDPCEIGAVSFDENSTTNTAGNPLTTWQWYFGDGSNLFAQDTSHLYNQAGDFNVSLIVTDNNNCQDTSTQIVRWHPAPIIDVNVQDSVGCQPLLVFFDNQSYPINGYSTFWNFGDGGTDTLASPTHIYTQHGTFLVHLHIISPTGCLGDFYDTITVHQIPNAAFNYSFDSCSFTGVQITDQSTPNQAGVPIQTWNWNYGDGGTAINVLDTLYPFTPRADYTVVLDIVDANGCRDTSIQVIPYHPAPVFTVPNHSINGCVPQTVVFSNNSLNNFPGYTFQWDFGDGNTSNAFDTTYIYTQEGIFYPTLTINTPAGCIGVSRDTVKANGIPQAVFSATYNPCEIGAMRFRNLSIPSQQGNLTTTLWTFGDGTTGNMPLQDHYYNYPDTGTYTVNLRVTDSNGCTDDTTKTVYWRPQPVFDIVLENSKGCVPHLMPAPISNPYPSQGYNVQWTLGNGTSSSLANPPAVVLTTPGVYTRRVVVSSPIGCVDSFSSVHTALEVPIAGFGFHATDGVLNSQHPSVQFSDSSQLAAQWWWNFGDNQTVLLRNPVHVYRDTGLFVVTQVVTHQNGCTDTLQKVLDIVPIFTYFLPNAFTPNADGKNDIFMGKGYFQYISTFEMRIFNRWGEQVFHTNSPYDSWNGRKNNTGAASPAGVYVVVVHLVGPRGERQEIKGFATIVY